MLDKQSEKFLKYIIENHKDNQISDFLKHYDKIDIHNDFIYDISKNLNDQGYITAITNIDNEILCVILHHKGYVYFEAKHSKNIEFWKNLAISKVSDIIVSFLIALLTTVVTHRLLP